MKARHCAAYVLLALMTVSSAAETNNPMPAIRSFDLKTIESLGRRIYEQDAYASRATDILFERVGGPERLTREGIAGWVVSEQGTNVVVRFVKAGTASVVPAYDVMFSTLRHGELSSAEGKRLSTNEVAQYKARQLALKNIPEYCSDRYNAVVLQNVGADGFLIYALAATTDPNLVLIGGHYRFTVSGDGSRIERTDRLFKTCLIVDKRDVPAGGETAGLYASHIVSDTPVETHVFLSLLNRQPMYIVTKDGNMWKIDKGAITALGKADGRDKAASDALEGINPKQSKSQQ